MHRGGICRLRYKARKKFRIGLKDFHLDLKTKNLEG